MTIPTVAGLSPRARVDAPRASPWTAREDLRSLIPGLAAVALWLVWVDASGGYNAEAWYPSGLGILSLWSAVLVLGGRVLPRARWARIGLLAFAALVGLNYLSILWAASPGNALDSSNQLAVYLLMAWIFAVLPWTARALALAVGCWTIGVCALSIAALVNATGASSLTAFFVDGRYASPMRYSNATAALGVMAMWPALILSTRRELPAWLRPPLLGAAVFLANYAILPQSRAALLGLALTAVVALAACSGRLRLLVRMALVGGGLAVCIPRAVAVDNAVSAGADVTPVLRHAAAVISIVSLAAVGVGILLVLVEARLAARGASARARLRRRGSATDGRAARRQRYAIAGLSAAAIAVAAVVAAPAAVRIAHTVVRQGNADASTGSVRLLSASPEERFDYDRVALHLFSGSPVVGIGSGNFGLHYDAQRRFAKHSQYTHNLPLRVLSETGLLGELAFVGLIAALVGGLVGVVRGRDDLARATAAIAMCVGGYFLVHSCLDWVDEFPALAAPAISLPLAAAGLRATAPAPASVRAGYAPRWLGEQARSRLGRASALAVGLVLVYALGSSYVSLRLVDRAFAIFRERPAHAYRDLALARSLDPLSASPSTSEGTIALYLGDTARSAAAFRRSLQREDAWYPRLELALIESHAGRTAAALRDIDAAARLDVYDPLIARVRTAIVAGRRLDPIAFNRLVVQEGEATSPGQQAIR